MSLKSETNPETCVVELTFRRCGAKGAVDYLREYTIDRTRHGRRVRKLLSEGNVSDAGKIYHLREFAYTERKCDADNRLSFDMGEITEDIEKAFAKNDTYQRMLAREREREARLAAKSAQSQKEPPLACDEVISDDDDPFEKVDTWDVSSSSCSASDNEE